MHSQDSSIIKIQVLSDFRALEFKESDGPFLRNRDLNFLTFWYYLGDTETADWGYRTLLELPQ